MLDKMGGPREYRFSSLRTFLGYMAAHPGKKLMFMGQEFAQYKEWNFQTPLDWEVLEFEPHYKLHEYVKALNRFYKDTPALWECDTSWEGFHWISAEDNTNSVIAFRRISRSKDEVIVVCNFQPVRHEVYEIGVPYCGDYTEVFSSDDVEFGGTGVSNGTLRAKNEPMHGEQYRISIDLPPMSVLYFTVNKPDEKAPGQTDAAAPVEATAPAEAASPGEDVPEAVAEAVPETAPAEMTVEAAAETSSEAAPAANNPAPNAPNRKKGGHSRKYKKKHR